MQLNIKIAYEALLANKLRAFLSALGVIFGVAAVISMLSIGKGTEQEILEQMKEVGVNNILITPFSKTVSENNDNSEDGQNPDNKDSQEPQSNAREQLNAYSPGLCMADLEAIKHIMPNIRATSPYIEQGERASYKSRYTDISLHAVSADYFSMFNYTLYKGNNFTSLHEEKGMQVCIISQNTKIALFGAEQAVGKKMKVGKLWFSVIGILEDIYKNKEKKNNNKLSVYIPVKTWLSRIEDPLRAKKQTYGNSNTEEKKTQLQKIIVQTDNTEQLSSSAHLLERVMQRRHNKVEDYRVVVPELLLKQQEETKSIFNLVLGIIAGISLLVGGIGIMNIMNASVLERTREIGVRLAIGANKKDISFQFLAEAVLICLLGGIIGVISGIVMSYLITKITEIKTIIAPVSVFTAFFVTTIVGIFFGYYPAKRASEKDPIESLRYE